MRNIHKYNEFINELNKSTYLNAANTYLNRNKIANDEFDESEFDEFDEYQYDQNKKVASELNKHSIYMDVVHNSDDKIKIEIFRDIYENHKEKKIYQKICTDYDKLLKHKRKSKDPILKKEEYNKKEEYRTYLYNKENILSERIVDYYDIKLGKFYTYKSEYRNNIETDMIRQITVSEIRFYTDKIHNIDILDIPFLIENGSLIDTNTMGEYVDGKWRIPKPKFKLDPNILKIRNEIIDYVNKNSYFEDDDSGAEIDVNKEYDRYELPNISTLSFSTRENGNVGEEKHSDIDYNEALKLKKLLLSKFNIDILIETVDEWVTLTVNIKN